MTFLGFCYSESDIEAKAISTRTAIRLIREINNTQPKLKDTILSVLPLDIKKQHERKTFCGIAAYKTEISSI